MISMTNPIMVSRDFLYVNKTSSVTPRKERSFKISSRELPFTNLRNFLKLVIWTISGKTRRIGEFQEGLQNLLPTPDT